MAFLSEDVQKAHDFGKFVIENAEWSLNTNDAIQLTKHLNWYNKMVGEINDHVMELRKVVQPEEKPRAPKAKAKSKAKGS